MNRLEFMGKLERLLAGISPGEREEALQFYNEYFNDAGVENEDGVIEALGSPEAVAATILAGLAEGAESAGEFSEKGFVPGGADKGTVNALQKTDKAAQNAQAERGGSAGADGSPAAGAAGAGKKEKKAWGAGTVVLVVLLSICALPLLIPFAMAAVIFMLAIFLLVFFMFLAGALVLGCLALVGLILLITGFILTGVGIAKMFIAPFGGLWIAGGGLAAAGIGLLMLVGFIWLLIKAVPAMIRGLVWLCGLPFRKKRKGAAA